MSFSLLRKSSFVYNLPLYVCTTIDDDVIVLLEWSSIYREEGYVLINRNHPVISAKSLHRFIHCNNYTLLFLYAIDGRFINEWPSSPIHNSYPYQLNPRQVLMWRYQDKCTDCRLGRYSSVAGQSIVFLGRIATAAVNISHSSAVTQSP